ncbi:MAG: InlB B-repeat-containing protein [Acholeplasmataceae bacterium]|jgi:uncharacterized repeat protein (TIGR02543 family)|nr:InlB B-repeat-containing protein [Acholeplasmataceae bacterium]
MKRLFKVFGLMLAMVFLTVTVISCEKEEKEDTYKVTFDLNYEGATGAPSAQTVQEGEKPSAPLEPTRSGYIFKGWFDAKTAGSEYRFDTAFDKDTTLYAVWEEESVDGGNVYYLAGSFTSYKEDDTAYKMLPVSGQEGVYELTVELTDDNRDSAYDGHYYKVTNGTWDADGCWGVDSYYIDPAPTSPTGGGLGSVWHWANGTLKVTWDENEKKITDELTMAEEIIVDVYAIYGEFNGWAIEGENAVLIKDVDQSGVYIAEIEFNEEITSDFTVVVNKLWWDDQWGQRWGAHEQYKFDGQAAGMGSATELTLAAGRYYFSFDSATKITTYQKVEKDVVIAYANPRLYGEFNAWAIEGKDAVFLKDLAKSGIYQAELTFAEAIKSDFTIAVSQKFYDDEWGQRWGVDEQYQLDGSAAGMGVVTTLELEAGTYLFSYNSKTHVTTHLKVEADTIYEFESPRIYGEFNGWDIEDEKAVVLKDLEGDGIYQAEITFTETVESDFTVVVSKKFYDDEWGKRWGAEEQYKLDGLAAGMGDATRLELEAGTYLFSYDSKTNVTTHLKVEADVIYEFATPRVYGAFNSWAIEGENAIVLTEAEAGKFSVTLTFAEDLETDIITVLSKKYYDDEWGERWGAEEQYNIDGTVPGMGAPQNEYEAGEYELVYDSATKKLTITKK